MKEHSKRLTIKESEERADVETGLDETSSKRQIASSFHFKVSAGLFKVLVAFEAMVQVVHDMRQRFNQSLVKLKTEHKMNIQ